MAVCMSTLSASSSMASRLKLDVQRTIYTASPKFSQEEDSPLQEKEPHAIEQTRPVVQCGAAQVDVCHTTEMDGRGECLARVVHDVPRSPEPKQHFAVIRESSEDDLTPGCGARSRARTGLLDDSYIQRGLAIETGQQLRRAKGKIVVVTNLEKLFLTRKKRVLEAIKRHLLLVRWVAKTKVCLFVHLVWCVEWFRKKCENNLRIMTREVQTMEQIDAEKLAAFQVLFKTSMGMKLVKKEMAAWRANVKLTSSASGTVASATTQVQDDTVIIAAPTTGSTATSDDPQSGFDASLVRLRNCFAAFDLDGSGTLDLDEFQLMISYLRTKDHATTTKKNSKKVGAASSTLSKQAKLSTAQIRGLFEDLDEDGSGRVTCEEFEKWWKKQHDEATKSTSSSASSSFLSGGLDRIVLESHGLLFWLLGKKQQLERKFAKKIMITTAADAAKLEFLQTRMRLEASPPARRCPQCGRRFELQRDLNEHVRSIGCATMQLVVDTFVLKKWLREEEIRLLNDGDE